MSDLKKTILVTGGSRGIGQAIVKNLATTGMQIYFTYTSQPDSAEEVCREIAEQGGLAKSFKLDSSDWEAVEHFFNSEIKNKIYLSALVNNAGITRDNLIMRMKRDDWEKVLNINLTGSFICLQQAGKIMMKQRAGVIVNISSVVGEMGNAGQANYAASKAGLIGLTKSAAKEFAPRGVRVNAITPGFISSKMTDVLSEDIKNDYKNSIPLQKFGMPEDVAHAVAFLISDAAQYITGQVIGINGGLYM